MKEIKLLPKHSDGVAELLRNCLAETVATKEDVKALNGDVANKAAPGEVRGEMKLRDRVIDELGASTLEDWWARSSSVVTHCRIFDE